MAHFYVSWGGHIRHAQAADDHEAKIKAFGVVAMNMKAVKLPKSPRYMSVANKKKYEELVR